MLVLLVVTVLFAGGALFVKYKLENLRAGVLKSVESRTGVRLRVGAVVVNGLRGLRLDDAEVALESTTGPKIQFGADVAYVYINVVDLLYGQVTIDRIETDNARIRLDRPTDRAWIAPPGDQIRRSGPTPRGAFLSSDWEAVYLGYPQRRG